MTAKQWKCWHLLALKFDQFQTSSNNFQQVATIRNNTQHGVQTLGTCWAQQCCVFLANNVASVCTGVKLKMAKVIPIFKSDDNSDPNNYRPISLLPCFNRIFEKLVYKRMKSFIEEKNILSTSQYGFRQGHSTEYAILNIVSRIQSNMDAGAFSCGAFIDLKKAFDTVDHGILRKLDFYGFRGIINVWFRSYLQDRTQITVIDQRSSNKSVVTYGVPQGSVFGPLLFLQYVNDIYSSSNKLSFYLFADDTNILYSHKNLTSLENVINFELNNVFQWLTSNKLTLNQNKSNFVIFRPYQKRLPFAPKICILDHLFGM